MGGIITDQQKNGVRQACQKTGRQFPRAIVSVVSINPTSNYTRRRFMAYCGELVQSGRSVKQESSEAIKASRLDAEGIAVL